MTLEEFFTEILNSPAKFRVDGFNIRDEQGLCPICSLLYHKSGGRIRYETKHYRMAATELGLSTNTVGTIIGAADHPESFLRYRLLQACRII